MSNLFPLLKSIPEKKKIVFVSSHPDPYGMFIKHAAIRCSQPFVHKDDGAHGGTTNPYWFDKHFCNIEGSFCLILCFSPDFFIIREVYSLGIPVVNINTHDGFKAAQIAAYFSLVFRPPFSNAFPKST